MYCNQRDTLVLRKMLMQLPHNHTSVTHASGFEIEQSVVGGRVLRCRLDFLPLHSVQSQNRSVAGQTNKLCVLHSNRAGLRCFSRPCCGHAVLRHAAAPCCTAGRWLASTTSSTFMTSRTAATSRPTLTTRACATWPWRRCGCRAYRGVCCAVQLSVAMEVSVAVQLSVALEVSIVVEVSVAVQVSVAGSHPVLSSSEDAFCHSHLCSISWCALGADQHLLQHCCCCCLCWVVTPAGGPLQAWRGAVWHRLPHLQCRRLWPVCHGSGQH